MQKPIRNAASGWWSAWSETRQERRESDIARLAADSALQQQYEYTVAYLRLQLVFIVGLAIMLSLVKLLDILLPGFSIAELLGVGAAEATSVSSGLLIAFSALAIAQFLRSEEVAARLVAAQRRIRR